MNRYKAGNNSDEKRAEHRPATSRDYRIEIKYVGHPIYQFRLINVTNEGASILIKDDSAFLNLIITGKPPAMLGRLPEFDNSGRI